MFTAATFAILPVLDESRCIGCGDCVAVCPADCLELRVEPSWSRPWLPRPGECIPCGACVVICPTDAIALVENRLPGSPCSSPELVYTPGNLPRPEKS